MIKKYYDLTKPGIIFGNAITAIGGFMLAARGHIDWWCLIAMLVGLSCIIGSACVFNNYIDRGIDEKMARTKNRAFVQGLIPVGRAFFFATCLGLFGAFILAVFTNLLTLACAVVGFFFYVVVYSIAKRTTSYGTVIGSIAGGAPPVVGYCAVSHSLDIGALIIFLIVVLWQMPHFYAIALYRLADYDKAGLPVLPVAKGIYRTKVHMLLYVVAFGIAALLPTVAGYTGYLYFAVALLLGLVWLWLSIKGFQAKNDTLWARKMFIFSLVVIMLICVMIPLDIMRT